MMHLVDYVRQMAEYNRWMNQKVYAACEKLPAEQLSENRGAFFGSILGTLNHLAVADTIWLKRFAATGNDALVVMNEIPYPQALDAQLCNSLPELRELRARLDETLLAFANLVTQAELDGPVIYKSLRGDPSSKILFGLLMHVFNHQTHHRGQVTTLLSQFGVDVGVTDLVVLIPNINGG